MPQRSPVQAAHKNGLLKNSASLFKSTASWQVRPLDQITQKVLKPSSVLENLATDCEASYSDSPSYQ